MKQLYTLLFFFTALAPYAASAQDARIKNVIIMIPDGASNSLLTLSRWANPGYKPLAIDSIICGLVKTHSSNAPIGDSAPTGSTYSTGELSQSGFVATYPPQDTADLVYIDPSRILQPQTTIIEAAKLSGRATGLVFSCQLPHATPADFCAHTAQREDYEDISKQMVYNAPDVVLGGGSAYLDGTIRKDRLMLKDTLIAQGFGYASSYADFNKIKDRQRVWGSFAPYALPYVSEKEPNIPTLAEMTISAIHILKNSKKGFVLMVEGSKIDWAAHNNAAPDAIEEFMDFDRAVSAALQFARKDRHTLVIVLPDHATGGLSLGSKRKEPKYDKLPLKTLYPPKLPALEPLSALAFEHGSDSLLFNRIMGGLAPIKIEQADFEKIKTAFLTLRKAIAEQQPPIDKMNPILMKKRDELTRALSAVVNSQTYLSWATNGHDAGYVFLGVYHPNGRLPEGGVRENTQIAPYLCQELRLPNLRSLTEQNFVRHDRLFSAYLCKITKQTGKSAVLEVFDKGHNLLLSAEASQNYALARNKNGVMVQKYFQRKNAEASSLCIYNTTEKEGWFFLPDYVLEWIEK